MHIYICMHIHVGMYAYTCTYVVYIRKLSLCCFSLYDTAYLIPLKLIKAYAQND